MRVFDESVDNISGSPSDNAVFLSFPPPPPAHDDDDAGSANAAVDATDTPHDAHRADDGNDKDIVGDMEDYMGFGDSDTDA